MRKEKTSLTDKRMIIVFYALGAINVINIIFYSSMLMEMNNAILAQEETVHDLVFWAEKNKLYNESNYDKLKVTGLYYGGDKQYYCVWIKNRDPLNIEKTECHEYCHYLVDEDWWHFCK